MMDWCSIDCIDSTQHVHTNCQPSMYIHHMYHHLVPGFLSLAIQILGSMLNKECKKQTDGGLSASEAFVLSTPASGPGLGLC